MKEKIRLDKEAVYDRLMLFGHRVGCHQRADRSFFWKGYQFPVCARCTGVLLSYLATIPLYLRYPCSYIVSVSAAAIMFVDWFLQFAGCKQSTNIRRLITGILGGYGIMSFQLHLLLNMISWLQLRF